MKRRSLGIKLCSQWPLAWEQPCEAFLTTPLRRKSSFPLMRYFLSKASFRPSRVTGCICILWGTAASTSASWWKVLYTGSPARGHGLVSTAPGSPHQLHLHGAKPVPCLLCLPAGTTTPSFYLFAVKPGTTPQLAKDESTAALEALCRPHLSHVLLQGCCRTHAFGSPAFLLQEWVRFVWTK